MPETETTSDGMIKVDDPFAKQIGFTSDKFQSHSYLWRKGNEIWISAIAATEIKRGYFSNLLVHLKMGGYKIIVPTPLGAMPDICRKRGFMPHEEILKDGPMAGDVLETFVWEAA